MQRICRLCGEKHNKYQSCQSYKDTWRSREITREHRASSYCKEWQQCSECVAIKQSLRILLHFSGRCVGRTNNRCPVCFEQRQVSLRFFDVESNYRERIQDRVKELYVSVLKGH